MLLQRNFVSMASHEFRTPLTIIDGHARRLIKTKDTVTADEIGERAGRRVTLAARVDPNILGGIVLRVGNSILDASIRNRLEQLRRHVAQGAS